MTDEAAEAALAEAARVVEDAESAAKAAYGRALIVWAQAIWERASEDELAELNLHLNAHERQRIEALLREAACMPDDPEETL